RVFVLNVSASSTDRPLRSPLDVVMTSFSHARSQRYDLEMRFTPNDVQVIELPRPRDARDLFDFSGAHELIDEAYDLTCGALDRLERETVVEIHPEDESITADRRRRFRLRRGA